MSECSDSKIIVKSLTKREINCNDFIERAQNRNNQDFIDILLELCKYKDDEYCIICFRFLYTNSMNNWALRKELLDEVVLNEIKERFDKMIKADNKNSALVSIFYYTKDHNGNSIFTFDDLKKSCNDGDKLAPCIIGHILNNEDSIPYYKLAVKRGNSYAAYELMKIYLGKKKGYIIPKNMDKVYKYYIKGKSIKNDFEMDSNIYLEYPRLFAELTNYIYSKLKEKEALIQEKEKLITELLYEPGGRGYQEAKSDFEKLNQVL